MPEFQDWLRFASSLRAVGLNIFNNSNIQLTEQGAADSKVLGLMFLARTLSNLKGALLLIENKRLVESRILARCCYENQYWVIGLINGGEKFKDEMVAHEMQHKRRRMQTLFEVQDDLEETIEQKMREWMRENKKWADAKTLEPKKVAMRQSNQSYIFYQHLSWDSHPSIETLNRYYLSPDEQGVPGIDVEPTPTDDELIETLNLLCLPVIGVFIGVSELLGSEELPEFIKVIAEEYKLLTTQSANQHSI